MGPERVSRSPDRLAGSQSPAIGFIHARRQHAALTAVRAPQVTSRQHRQQDMPLVVQRSNRQRRKKWLVISALLMTTGLI